QTATRSYTVTLGSWVNSGAAYDCSNWSPAPETVTVGQSYTQTASDCKQNQTRSRVERFVDHASGSTITAVNSTESQVITGQSSTRNSVGTKQTWVAATPSYTAWTTTSSLDNCSNWTPSPSVYTESNTTNTFKQTANNCTTTQTRTVQPREQESTTKEFRNSGNAYSETQTLTNQTATRDYTVKIFNWYNISDPYECTYTPAPSEIESGVTFTQVADDCKIHSRRGRTETYIDHQTGNIVDAKPPSDDKILINQHVERSNVGTYSVCNAPSNPALLAPASSGIYAASYSAFSGTEVTVSPGANFTLKTYMMNKSSVKWDSVYKDSANPLRLSYHVFDANNATVITHDGVRTDIKVTVCPQNTLVVDQKFKAPTATGTYTFRVGLVKEYVAWFDGMGVTPLLIKVNVR
ncbi:hypothetical protein ACI2KR_07965, partial [Pseudomonas luteola]